MGILVSLHILAVILWVGGMFFAHQVLRPVAADQLEPPARLRLWAGVFPRFFIWVWVSVLVLPISGYWMIFGQLGGMANVGLYVHVMQTVGLVMIGVYIWLYFGPYQRLLSAVAEERWPDGGAALVTIRKTVGFNLILGIIATVVAAAGRYFVA